MNDGNHHSEIIIIKRGGEGEDGHHGGAWKIAFADFMTAMMALFLVLWLINAANEETKKSVASYFNPVKLVDRNRSTKGLLDAAGPQESTETENDEETAAAKAAEKTQEAETKPTTAELFENPYGVLAKIASRPPGLESPAARKNVSPGNTGQLSGSGQGETFRDPFDPEFWQAEVAGAARSGSAAEAELNPSSEIAEPAVGAADTAKEVANDGPAQEQDVSVKTLSTADEKPSADTADSKDVEDKQSEADAEQAAKEKEQAAEEKKKAAEQLDQEIKMAIGSVEGIDPDLAKSIKVVADEDGVLISLADEMATPMFEIGSAVPSRDIVLAMEQLAGVLVRKPGRLRVYGHTDARPYKTRNYDNWQLSVARAQSAYFMLVRGGIGQDRLSEVSGFADSRLSDTQNPENGANRRIEILLETAS